MLELPACFVWRDRGLRGLRVWLFGRVSDSSAGNHPCLLPLNKEASLSPLYRCATQEGSKKKRRPRDADASEKVTGCQALVDLSRFFLWHRSPDQIGLHLSAEAGVTFGDGACYDTVLDDFLGLQHLVRREADLTTINPAFGVA